MYETGKRSFRVAINTLETPAGGQYPLVLSDGTKIFLNSVSRLDFPEQFAADKRVVHFSGEGYFEVAKDSLRPFFVIKQSPVSRQLLPTSCIKPKKPSAAATIARWRLSLPLKNMWLM